MPRLSLYAAHQRAVVKIHNTQMHSTSFTVYHEYFFQVLISTVFISPVESGVSSLIRLFNIGPPSIFTQRGHIGGKHHLRLGEAELAGRMVYYDIFQGLSQLLGFLGLGRDRARTILVIPCRLIISSSSGYLFHVESH